MNDSKKQKLYVPCPRCKTRVHYSTENPHRPFCSEKCQTVDLGQWAREDYKIPCEDQIKIEDLHDDESGNESSPPWRQ